MKKKINEFKFDNGQVLEDIVTGYKGVVFCSCSWLYQRNTYGLKSKELTGGVPSNLVYFDEESLKAVKKMRIEMARKNPDKK